jgi:GntR family transcriptional regulator, transcriptional repressor for pyruvate dehydrogenase complex
MSDAMDEKFTAIVSGKNGTTTQEVVIRLREMIQCGELSAGDRLPPERDLAKLLGVSRPTLRAGIRSLSTVGILQSRQGAGTFVVAAADSPVLDGSQLKLLAALHGFTSEEIFEVWISLEVSNASFAAQRATTEQIKQMNKEIGKMNASFNDSEKFFEHEKRFHDIIASASQNRVLTALTNMIAAILFEFQRKVVSANHLKDLAEQNHKIYLAIRERNSKNAGEAMSESLPKKQAAYLFEFEIDKENRQKAD